ncbi:MAG TPA: hypothetical protein ENI90_05215 [Methylothermaceae bacterium]|nr:hypothetical protein [Methylothermaceae bacterium]
MRIPSVAQLLELWEWGDGQPPAMQGLSLLALACPERSEEELAHLPIGERDALLARLYAALFGLRQEVVTDCPRCSERLEFPLDLDQLYGGDSRSAAEVTVGEKTIRFRLPDSTDLLEIAHLEAEAARRTLLARCLVDDILADDLTEAEIEALERAMEEADPGANILITLDCPECGHQWQALFDLLEGFRDRLEVWIRQQLLDVHYLAQAYGWSEREILAMSPRRRRIYLEMLA